MKSFFVGLCLIWAMVAQAQTCCSGGCSASSNQMGILPQFRNSFVGLRGSLRTFTTKQSLADVKDVSHETFYTLEGWGRYTPHRRWQFFAFVPIQIKQQSYLQQQLSNYGLGDITLSGNFVAVDNTQDSVAHDWKHTLLIGAGLKMPTGAYRQKDAQNQYLLPTLQLGTGSWDVSTNLNYVVRYRSVGTSIEASYRINTYNGQFYKFGNRTTLANRFFYWYRQNKLSLMPHLGWSWEQSQRDHSYQRSILETGGNAAFVLAGLDIYWRKWMFGLSMQQPVYQQIGNGTLTQYTRLNVQCNFIF